MVGKKYRLTEDMRDAAKALDLPLAKTSLTLRQIYADAPGHAKVVWRMGARGREAGKEIKTLLNELLPEAVRGSRKGILYRATTMLPPRTVR